MKWTYIGVPKVYMKLVTNMIYIMPNVNIELIQTILVEGKQVQITSSAKSIFQSNYHD